MVGQIREPQLNAKTSNYWYRQSVVDRIHELYQNNSIELGHCPNFTAWAIDNNEIELLESVIIFFGTWSNAMAQSGLGPMKQQDYNETDWEYWHPERVLEHVQKLFSSHFDLSARFIKQVYPELFSAAVSKDTFASWPGTLDEAGVDPKRLRTNHFRFWTLERITRTIFDYNQTFGDIQPEVVKELNPSLYSGSRRYFKNWSETVNAAQLSLDKNLAQVILIPFREHILTEYIKRLFEIQGKEYREQPNKDHNQILDRYGSEIPMLMEFPNNILEPIDQNGRACISTTHYSWGLNIVPEVNDLLTKYSDITYYYSSGEPRKWVNYNRSTVTFIDSHHFYPELINLGLDDIISDLGLLARGGIPTRYKSLLDELLKAINVFIKKRKG